MKDTADMEKRDADRITARTPIAEFLSNSQTDTERLGAALGKEAEAGLFVALNGDLGSGKTAFTRGLARGLGVSGDVTSPTFQLLREYQGRLPLFHFDFYRLGSAAEVDDLDLDGCLERGVVSAEWSGMFEEFVRGDYIELQLEWVGENSRRITITRAGGTGSQIVGILIEAGNK